MYKTSNDRRFRKNKTAIQRAYIDLVVEKGYQHVTITDIADRADINRMTFYAHYETIEDNTKCTRFFCGTRISRVEGKGI